jgi:hypothetical protein
LNILSARSSYAAMMAYACYSVSVFEHLWSILGMFYLPAECRRRLEAEDWESQL